MLPVSPCVPPPEHPHNTPGSLLPRYRSGIRGYMKAVVLDLLRRYLQVEMQFQHGEGLGGSGDWGGSRGGGCRAHGALPHSSLRQVRHQPAGTVQT